MTDLIRCLKRPISFILLCCFFVTQTGVFLPGALAYPSETAVQAPAFHLVLPPELGKVQAIVSGTGPTIVHLQTAHGNYQAQKKIKAILQLLKKQYGFKDLYLEGSSYELEPDYIRFFPHDEDLTRRVADGLARRALLKGAELFLIEDRQSRGHGIEDLETYKRNVAHFRAVLTQKRNTNFFLESMARQIERLSSPYLNKHLRDFLRRLDDFESKPEVTPIQSWLTYLQDQAGRVLGINLADAVYQLDWPMLLRYFKLREIERRFEASVYEAEKPKFLKALSALPPDMLNTLRQQLEAPLGGQELPDPETGLFYERLASQLPASFSFQDYPQTVFFITHLILQSELKGERLLDEMQQLEERIANELARNEDERQLVFLFKDYRLLKKLLALELTPRDYERAEERKEAMRPSRIASRFQEINRENRVKGVEFEETSALDRLFDAAYQFYTDAQARDVLMVENMEAGLKASGVQKAVVITGGFHAEPFLNHFRSRGYNYALIAPKITKFGGRESYEDLMLQSRLQSATLESVFQALPHNKIQTSGFDPLLFARAFVTQTRRSGRNLSSRVLETHLRTSTQLKQYSSDIVSQLIQSPQVQIEKTRRVSEKKPMDAGVPAGSQALSVTVTRSEVRSSSREERFDELVRAAQAFVNDFSLSPATVGNQLRKALTDGQPKKDTKRFYEILEGYGYLPEAYRAWLMGETVQAPEVPFFVTKEQLSSSAYRVQESKGGRKFRPHDVTLQGLLQYDQPSFELKPFYDVNTNSYGLEIRGQDGTSFGALILKRQGRVLKQPMQWLPQMTASLAAEEDLDFPKREGRNSSPVTVRAEIFEKLTALVFHSVSQGQALYHAGFALDPLVSANVFPDLVWDGEIYDAKLGADLDDIGQTLVKYTQLKQIHPKYFKSSTPITVVVLDTTATQNYQLQGYVSGEDFRFISLEEFMLERGYENAEISALLKRLHQNGQSFDELKAELEQVDRQLEQSRIPGGSVVEDSRLRRRLKPADLTAMLQKNPEQLLEWFRNAYGRALLYQTRPQYLHAHYVRLKQLLDLLRPALEDRPSISDELPEHEKIFNELQTAVQEFEILLARILPAGVYSLEADQPRPARSRAPKAAVPSQPAADPTNDSLTAPENLLPEEPALDREAAGQPSKEVQPPVVLAGESAADGDHVPPAPTAKSPAKVEVPKKDVLVTGAAQSVSEVDATVTPDILPAEVTDQIKVPEAPQVHKVTAEPIPQTMPLVRSGPVAADKKGGASHADFLSHLRNGLGAPDPELTAMNDELEILYRTKSPGLEALDALVFGPDSRMKKLYEELFEKTPRPWWDAAAAERRVSEFLAQDFSGKKQPAIEAMIVEFIRASPNRLLESEMLAIFLSMKRGRGLMPLGVEAVLESMFEDGTPLVDEVRLSLPAGVDSKLGYWMLSLAHAAILRFSTNEQVKQTALMKNTGGNLAISLQSAYGHPEWFFYEDPAFFWDVFLTYLLTDQPDHSRTVLRFLKIQKRKAELEGAVPDGFLNDSISHMELLLGEREPQEKEKAILRQWSDTAAWQQELRDDAMTAVLGLAQRGAEEGWDYGKFKSEFEEAGSALADIRGLNLFLTQTFGPHFQLRPEGKYAVLSKISFYFSALANALTLTENSDVLDSLTSLAGSVGGQADTFLLVRPYYEALVDRKRGTVSYPASVLMTAMVFALKTALQDPAQMTFMIKILGSYGNLDSKNNLKGAQWIRLLTRLLSEQLLRTNTPYNDITRRFYRQIEESLWSEDTDLARASGQLLGDIFAMARSQTASAQYEIQFFMETLRRDLFEHFILYAEKRDRVLWSDWLAEEAAENEWGSVLAAADQVLEQDENSLVRLSGVIQALLVLRAGLKDRKVKEVFDVKVMEKFKKMETTVISVLERSIRHGLLRERTFSELEEPWETLKIVMGGNGRAVKKMRQIAKNNDDLLDSLFVELIVRDDEKVKAELKAADTLFAAHSEGPFENKEALLRYANAHPHQMVYLLRFLRRIQGDLSEADKTDIQRTFQQILETHGEKTPEREGLWREIEEVLGDGLDLSKVQSSLKIQTLSISGISAEELLTVLPERLNTSKEEYLRLFVFPDENDSEEDWGSLGLTALLDSSSLLRTTLESKSLYVLELADEDSRLKVRLKQPVPIPGTGEMFEEFTFRASAGKADSVSPKFRALLLKALQSQERENDTVMTVKDEREFRDSLMNHLSKGNLMLDGRSNIPYGIIDEGHLEVLGSWDLDVRRIVPENQIETLQGQARSDSNRQSAETRARFLERLIRTITPGFEEAQSLLIDRIEEGAVPAETGFIHEHLGPVLNLGNFVDASGTLNMDQLLSDLEMGVNRSLGSLNPADASAIRDKIENLRVAEIAKEVLSTETNFPLAVEAARERLVTLYDAIVGEMAAARSRADQTEMRVNDHRDSSPLPGRGGMTRTEVLDQGEISLTPLDPQDQGQQLLDYYLQKELDIPANVLTDLKLSIMGFTVKLDALILGIDSKSEFHRDDWQKFTTLLFQRGEKSLTYGDLLKLSQMNGSISRGLAEMVAAKKLSEKKFARLINALQPVSRALKNIKDTYSLKFLAMKANPVDASMASMVAGFFDEQGRMYAATPQAGIFALTNSPETTLDFRAMLGTTSVDDMLSFFPVPLRVILTPEKPLLDLAPSDLYLLQRRKPAEIKKEFESRLDPLLGSEIAPGVFMLEKGVMAAVLQVLGMSRPFKAGEFKRFLDVLKSEDPVIYDQLDRSRAKEEELNDLFAYPNSLAFDASEISLDNFRQVKQWAFGPAAEELGPSDRNFFAGSIGDLSRRHGVDVIGALLESPMARRKYLTNRADRARFEALLPRVLASLNAWQPVMRRNFEKRFGELSFESRLDPALGVELAPGAIIFETPVIDALTEALGYQDPLDMRTSPLSPAQFNTFKEYLEEHAPAIYKAMDVSENGRKRFNFLVDRKIRVHFRKAGVDSRNLDRVLRANVATGMGFLPEEDQRFFTQVFAAGMGGDEIGYLLDSPALRRVFVRPQDSNRFERIVNSINEAFEEFYPSMVRNYESRYGVFEGRIPEDLGYEILPGVLVLHRTVISALLRFENKTDIKKLTFEPFTPESYVRFLEFLSGSPKQQAAAQAAGHEAFNEIFASNLLSLSAMDAPPKRDEREMLALNAAMNTLGHEDYLFAAALADLTAPGKADSGRRRSLWEFPETLTKDMDAAQLGQWQHIAAQIQRSRQRFEKTFDVNYEKLPHKRSEIRRSSLSPDLALTRETRVVIEIYRQYLLPLRFEAFALTERARVLEELLQRRVNVRDPGFEIPQRKSVIKDNLGEGRWITTSAADEWFQGAAEGRVLLDAVWMRQLIRHSPRTLFVLLRAMDQWQSERRLAEPLLAVSGQENVSLEDIRLALQNERSGLSAEEKAAARDFLETKRLRELITIVPENNLPQYLRGQNYGVATLSTLGSSWLSQLPLGAQFLLNPESVADEDLVSVAFLIPALLKAAREVRGIQGSAAQKAALLRYLHESAEGVFRPRGEGGFLIQLSVFIVKEIIQKRLVAISA